MDNNGLLEGHSHVVIEAISALDSEDPPDPLKFTYFKGMNAGAQNGVLSVEVTGGLEVGIYRMSSVSNGFCVIRLISSLLLDQHRNQSSASTRFCRSYVSDIPF